MVSVPLPVPVPVPGSGLWGLTTVMPASDLLHAKMRGSKEMISLAKNFMVKDLLDRKLAISLPPPLRLLRKSFHTLRFLSS